MQTFEDISWLTGCEISVILVLKKSGLLSAKGQNSFVYCSMEQPPKNMPKKINVCVPLSASKY